MIVARDAAGNPKEAVFGTVALTTDGLGITSGNPLRLLQGTESAEEAAMLSQWFDAQWSGLAGGERVVGSCRIMLFS
jgi:hypothetical protein